MSGPLPSILAPVTWPLSLLYGWCARMHGARGAANAWHAPRPVISVGNISVGGTGKSPMVRWVCQAVRELGTAPAIVMRGHRGGERSDEVMEHRACCPEVPVAVDRDRRAAMQALLAARPDVGALVLDDGFQHRRVARDLDLVLVDAARPAIDGGVLPMGWLREPASGLRRAGAVVVTRASRAEPWLIDRITRLHGRPPLAMCDHAWHELLVTEARVSRREPLHWLRGRRVAAWAGIGHPVPFLDQLAAQGAAVVHAPRLADHQRFDRALVARLLAEAGRAGVDAVVCTGKDWVKLADTLPDGAPPFVRAEVRMAFTAGERALRDALAAAIGVGDSSTRR